MSWPKFLCKYKPSFINNSHLFQETKIYVHNILFYLGRKKTIIFKYMNSSNVTKCEARLKIYLYPHTRKLLQWLPGYEEPTNLFDLASRRIEGDNGIVAWLPRRTRSQYNPCILSCLLHFSGQEVFHQTLECIKNLCLVMGNI